MGVERGTTIVAIEKCRADGRQLGMGALTIHEKIRRQGCPRKNKRYLATLRINGTEAQVDQELASRLPACLLCNLHAQYQDVNHLVVAPDGSDDNLPWLP